MEMSIEAVLAFVNASMSSEPEWRSTEDTVIWSLTPSTAWVIASLALLGLRVVVFTFLTSVFHAFSVFSEGVSFLASVASIDSVAFEAWAPA